MIDSKGKDIILSRRADIKPDGLKAPTDGAYVIDPLATYNRPKLKFNYTVSFNFRESMGSNSFLNSNGDTKMSDTMTFAIKQASRPNPTVVYQDANFYNYRTKVATKVDYGTMQITMFDDVSNNAHKIFETYMKMISPIANVTKAAAKIPTYLEQNGINNILFNQANSAGGRSFGGTGSLGPLLEGHESGLISDITIRHWFYSEVIKRKDGSEIKTQTTPDETKNRYDTANIQFVEYQFINPKIVNMTLDELDMSQSDASTVMLNFVYDSVFISSPAEAGSEISPIKPYIQPKEEEFMCIAPPEYPRKNPTLNDIVSRARDVERLMKKYKRLDTIPDFSVFQTVGHFMPSSLLGNNLPNVPDFKANVDLPPILEGFIDEGE